MTTFQIQGQVSHKIGSVLVSPKTDSTFMQIYFVKNVEKKYEILIYNLPCRETLI